eukprot:SAG22_NODE_1166_length_5291_cov_4.322227_2_plen_65_part_00
MDQNSVAAQQLKATISIRDNIKAKLDERTICNTTVKFLDGLIEQCGHGDLDLKVKLENAKGCLD